MIQDYKFTLHSRDDLAGQTWIVGLHNAEGHEYSDEIEIFKCGPGRPYIRIWIARIYLMYRYKRWLDQL